MGYPIEEYEEGDSCSNCWGPSKTFGDVPTPKRIRVTGSGFAGACAPCNNTFVVEQTNLFPCRYEYFGAIVDIVINFGAVNTAFSMSVDGVGLCYAKNEGLCILTSTDVGKTVTIEIDRPLTPEYKIAKAQNFAPSDHTWFENFGPSNGDEVLRLANKLDRICLYAKFEPDY